MVTLRRPRVKESRLVQRVPNKTSTEFCSITLKEPVVDPEWISRHPRFQRETKAPRQLPQIEPQFYAKKIFNRVPSASGTPRRTFVCDRRERSQSSSTCRYSCELLGPNLCKDCSKVIRRSEAVREYRHRCQRDEETAAARDPFHLLVASRENSKQAEYNDSEEELFEETEDEEFVLMATSRQPSFIASSRSPSQRDSGYVSRMSYIRNLSRASSGSFCCRLDSPWKPRQQSRTSDNRSEQQTSNEHGRVSSPVESTAISQNAYLASLREREGFKEILQQLYYPRKVRHAWKSLPVEPVEMELRLINFTIYDKEKLNQREHSLISE